MNAPYHTMTLDDALRVAVEFHRQGNLDRAETLYRQIIGYMPEYAQAHQLLGLILHQRGQHDAAMQAIHHALRLSPDDAEAWCNLGNVQDAVGEWAQAEESYRRAVERQPAFAVGWSNLANTLAKMHRHADAALACEKALAVDPHCVPAHLTLGIFHKEQGHFGEAARHFQQAAQHDPNCAEAFNNLGSLHAELGQISEAIECYARSLALAPGADAYGNLGSMYLELGRYEEAQACFEHVPGFTPDRARIEGNRLFTLHFDPAHSPQFLFEQACEWGRKYAPASLRMEPPRNVPDPDRRLRIGLVSADFKNHPVGYFLERVLAHTDPEKLHVTCYANQRRSDAMTETLKAHAADWRDISALDDDRAAALIARDGIDILVDLSGHTAGNRLGVFARKPAPVQVTWMGYFDTTGVAAMDYILADRFVIPPEEERYYIEKILRLPECYLCFSPPDYAIDPAPAPALANGYVTFGCFNRLSKITPEAVACWVEIMHRVPGAKLFLRNKTLSDAGARQRIAAQFAEAGLVPERLILKGHTARPEYLVSYNEVDIALDPFPYAGGTTTVEALWMSVPVVTLPQSPFVSRMGASILSNMGLDGFVCRDTSDYMDNAVALAADVQALNALRAMIRPKLLASPVCDGIRFATHLEHAFRTVWQHWCNQQE